MNLEELIHQYQTVQLRTSTSLETSEEEQKQMGLTDGLIRFSIGLDNDIQRTFELMKNCMEEVGVLKVKKCTSVEV